ncbi:hypothetical protein CRYUN_Cryun17cG0145900 [Craigia yunnanensis]
MASQNPNQTSSLYPEVIQSNPDIPRYSSSNNFYPSLDMRDLVENLFPDSPGYSVNRHNSHSDSPHAPTAPLQAVEEVLIKIPGAILNLIDKSYSVELACGDFTLIRLWQGQNIVAVLARVADEIQWPLMKDETAVKLDDSHYFFSLQLPKEAENDYRGSDDDKNKKNKTSGEGSDLLNYDRICDAVEVAGKNVMSTSSTVTTELVNQRYGEKAAEATNEGLGAAGHAVGTAWAAFKIRQALNPKSIVKPSKLAKAAAKAAAAEVKGKGKGKSSK